MWFLLESDRGSVNAGVFVLNLVFVFGLLVSPAAVRVVDGDTFDAGGVRYRLAGIDAPETSGAHCLAERRLGGLAAREVARLLASAGQVELIPTGAVQPATARYRRARVIASVSIDGRDLGDHLIAEGLARRWPARPGWCARR